MLSGVLTPPRGSCCLLLLPAVILCLLPALTGAGNHPLAKTHCGTSMVRDVCAVWLLWGGLGKPGIPTGHLNPEMASGARSCSLSLGMGRGHSTG